LAPERVKGEVALFCTTPVTLAPMTEEITVIPVPEPLLMMVPALLTAVVVSVTPAAVALLFCRTRVPVPPTPPLTVNNLVPLLLRKVVPPLFTFRTVPLTVRAEVVLFSVRPVTLEPTPPLMVVVPVPAPLLVIVPLLLTAMVLIVVEAVVVPLVMVRLPLPVMPPATFVEPVPLAAMVRSFPLRKTAPVKTAAVAPALLPIVNVPTAELPRLMALARVKELASRLADPPAASPRVMADAEGPAAPLTVVTLLMLTTTVPLLISNPPVNVLPLERVVTPPVVLTTRAMVPVPLSLMTPPKAVPPAPEPAMVNVKGVVPKLVMALLTVRSLAELLVHVWFAPTLTVVAERVTGPAFVLIANPEAPMDRAVPEMMSVPVAVIPLPMVIPAILVVPAFGWLVNVVELKRAVSVVRLLAGVPPLQFVFVLHVVFVTPVHVC